MSKMIRIPFRWVFAFLCPLVALAANGARANEASRPNVLFIAIDDLNDWIGCLGGHPQAQTPNIDRLARRGILFTNAHCASPACNPSRAAIFSGKMPWKTGVWSNESKRLFQQDPDAFVLPRAFSKSGYVTLGTGKLMHGGESANREMFDEHFNVEQRWSPFTAEEVDYTEAELSSKGTDNPRHVVTWQDSQTIVLPLNRMPSDRNPDSAAGESFDWGPIDVSDAAMGDTQTTDWAVGKLKESHDKPFFLGVGFYRPHIPLWAPKQYFDRFEGVKIALPAYLATDLDDLSPTGKRWALEAVTAGLHSTVVKHHQWEEAIKAYLACTTFVDAQVGRLLDALDQGRYADNTIIVLWTDHGWHLGEKQHWGKWTGWERSTRVPMMMVPPKNSFTSYEKLGQTCDEPVSLIDLYPTLAELCSVEAPGELDGKSLVPLLQVPDATTHRVVLTSFDPGNVSLRTDRWRYIHYEDGSEELYDLREDPNEWKNLAGESAHANLIQKLRGEIPNASLTKSSRGN